ncbi:MAG: hypothetical protein M1816_006675 [Peltula sp. TS41687]|nr:MAG: hypothetical protein M1816_006675 [Peltula sp. TS41687]
MDNLNNRPQNTQEAVTVSLEALRAGTVPFSTLEAAFGPTSLGIILVKDLPSQYEDLRHRLLSYSSHLANLPGEELEKLECPEAKWLIGWSRGRETLKNGVYDTLKGSYYVNCAFYKDPSLSSASGDYPSFPEYTAPNIWPSEDLLPSFRSTFTELCTLIIDTAVLVARACDQYASSTIEGYKPNYLETIVKNSTTTKARLLHYFPPLAAAAATTSESPPPTAHQDDWCATHLDHGCLTGLTSAMYVDETNLPPSSSSPSSSSSFSTSSPLPELLHPPSPDSGLYILSRTNTTTKITIPHDNLAFQTGQALEIITRGKFKAVPHFVRGYGSVRTGENERAMAVARNTLAVFTPRRDVEDVILMIMVTEPNLDDPIDERRTFADFARAVVQRNH